MTTVRTIAIIGTTASGKSDAAIALARERAGAVIGADSRQVYRHMDLGSGKEPGERCALARCARRCHDRALCARLAAVPWLRTAYLSGGVPHYMIDVVAPRTPYGAGQFVARATRVLHAFHRTGVLPIICGGTHFWVQSLVEGTRFPAVAPNAHLRRALAPLSCDALLARLAALDPRRAAAIRAKGEERNRVRLIRAIEIATALGAVPPQRTARVPADTLIVAIVPPRDVLAARIAQRLEKRLAAGMLDEVRALHTVYRVPWTRLEALGLEYAWCARFLRGQCSKRALRDGLARDIRAFAKRQETWIRRWERTGAPVHRFTTADAATTFLLAQTTKTKQTAQH